MARRMRPEHSVGTRDTRDMVARASDLSTLSRRRLPFASQAVLFVGLLYKHRRQPSSTGAGHPNPFDVIRKLHHDLSGQNPKADPEFDLVVGLAERIMDIMRWEHFLRSHRSPPR